MMRENHPKIPLTKIYAAKPFEEENSLKAYIMSEYIPNLYHIGMHDSIPAEDLLPIVQALATFSAIGQKLREEETKYARGANFLDMIFHQFMDETSIKRSETMMRNAFPEEYHEKVEQMLKNNQDYYLNPKMLNNFKNTCNFFGYQPVLTHSDAWSANFLCTKEGSKVNFKALIDFQTVSITTPAQDVARLFASCLSAKDRREKTDYLLEEYYKTFVKELNGNEVPYSLQNLKDTLLQILEHCRYNQEDKEGSETFLAITEIDSAKSYFKNIPHCFFLVWDHTYYGNHQQQNYNVV
ncbi:unnamed protein product [Caenorhabditis brenneri]